MLFCAAKHALLENGGNQGGKTKLRNGCERGLASCCTRSNYTKPQDWKHIMNDDAEVTKTKGQARPVPLFGFFKEHVLSSDT